MRKEYFEFEGEGKTLFSAVLWLPETEPKMVLQVVHGMTEHIERYENLAQVMTENGVAVAGYDLRGHGKNAANISCASLGDEGWEDTVKEIQTFHKCLKEKFEKSKHCLLGFSLGSFLVREYFSEYEDHDFDGAIIMGTGQQPAFILSIIMGIVKGQIKKAGFNETTDLIRNISFGTYNKKFKPNRTRADWLCSDEKELDKYISDKMCKEDISAGLFLQLLASMKRMADVAIYQKWNKDMPVLLISGSEDPVGDAGKGVKLVEKSMKKGGIKNVNLILLTGGRHDILHEAESGIAQEVGAILSEWLMKLVTF